MTSAPSQGSPAFALAARASVDAIGDIFGGPSGDEVFAWCQASVWRRDAELARLLGMAAQHERYRERARVVARDRLVEGPLLDALACAPLLDASAIDASARARLEILVWEAGAAALELPAFARWVWTEPAVFDLLVRVPAHGALRYRVVAARCLEIIAGNVPETPGQELASRALEVLQPLFLHPEPLVWVHAARALGRMTGPVDRLEGTLLDWVLGDSPLLRQRAVTAFASLPADRLKFFAGQLVALIDAPDKDASVLAAVAAATPYLFHERRDLWDRLAARVLASAGGSIAARALARGLATLHRRGRLEAVEAHLRELREMARRARPLALDDACRWIEVMAVTDVVDGAERDPLDLELGLENLTRLAAQYDDEEADARAARFASALLPTFQEAMRVAAASPRARTRAAAMNAARGCARAFALRLWGPLLATRPSGEPLEEPLLEETWRVIARSPAELLDHVAERRRAQPGADVVPLEVLALRLGGYALDACGEGGGLADARGPVAHATCLWLRKLEGLAAGARELPPRVEAALSALFWRLVDATRGTALGEVDDVAWLGPFAAWWALVIDRPAVLRKLASALPIMDASALESCCEAADALGAALSSSVDPAEWGPLVRSALGELRADDTQLAHALATLEVALDAFGDAAGQRPNLEALCLDLVLAGERLHTALADPVKALRPARDEGADALPEGSADNAPRVARLVARSIRGRQLGDVDVWLASLGPVASLLVEAAVRGAIRRTRPPPPLPRRERTNIEGYEIVRPLGEGGVGKVWLVRRPYADRLFVLKTPKADVLANASETERRALLSSFVEEAAALAGLYHPHVASIVDRGVSNGVPFLVLEYLIGADLKQYAAARPMSLFELGPVVAGACAGLSALHGLGLVHRDVKPANLWLRLPLQKGEAFDPEKHRDPATTPPLATVLIDFGMVRSTRVAPEVGGRFVAGTAGYIAPEQVLDPLELDVRADVYALAATIYNVTTGRAFFDDVESARDRILSHMQRDPFEDEGRLTSFPVAIARLLRAATDRDPSARPSAAEFHRDYQASL